MPSDFIDSFMRNLLSDSNFSSVRESNDHVSRVVEGRNEGTKDRSENLQVSSLRTREFKGYLKEKTDAPCSDNLGFVRVGKMAKINGKNG